MNFYQGLGFFILSAFLIPVPLFSNSQSNLDLRVGWTGSTPHSSSISAKLSMQYGGQMGLGFNHRGLFYPGLSAGIGFQFNQRGAEVTTDTYRENWNFTALELPINILWTIGVQQPISLSPGLVFSPAYFLDFRVSSPNGSFNAVNLVSNYGFSLGPVLRLNAGPLGLQGYYLYDFISAYRPEDLRLSRIGFDILIPLYTRVWK